MRYVLDSNARNEDLQWGRDYLKAYRPDEILTNSDHWRYVFAVRTDLGYRHPAHPWDSYPSLLSAGGRCGARAWFGRFICNAIFDLLIKFMIMDMCYAMDILRINTYPLVQKCVLEIQCSVL